MTEALPHRQYKVVVDGPRQITLRNRRFRRKILPVCRQAEDTIIEPLTRTPTTKKPPGNNLEIDVHHQTFTPTTTRTTPHETRPREEARLHDACPQEEVQSHEARPREEVRPHDEAPQQQPVLRRSLRIRRPPRPSHQRCQGNHIIDALAYFMNTQYVWLENTHLCFVRKPSEGGM